MPGPTRILSVPIKLSLDLSSAKISRPFGNSLDSSISISICDPMLRGTVRTLTADVSPPASFIGPRLVNRASRKRPICDTSRPRSLRSTALRCVVTDSSKRL